MSLEPLAPALADALGVAVRFVATDWRDGAAEKAAATARPGDVILLNGDIGRHGMAIMSVREGLAFDSEIASDCAPLSDLVLELLDLGIEIHCLRDLTRGFTMVALPELTAGEWQRVAAGGVLAIGA